MASPVQIDPEILAGTPVFADTKVPVQALLAYIESGETLNDFLDDFPSVSRDTAITFLESAKMALVEKSLPLV